MQNLYGAARDDGTYTRWSVRQYIATYREDRKVLVQISSRATLTSLYISYFLNSWPSRVFSRFSISDYRLSIIILSPKTIVKSSQTEALSYQMNQPTSCPHEIECYYPSRQDLCDRGLETKTEREREGGE